MKTFPGYVRGETPARSVQSRTYTGNVTSQQTIHTLICLGFTNCTSITWITQLTPYSLIQSTQQDLTPTDNSDIRARHLHLKPDPQGHHCSSEEIWGCRYMLSAHLEAKQPYLPPARLGGLGFHANALPLFRKDCKNWQCQKKRESNPVAQEGTWRKRP